MRFAIVLIILVSVLFSCGKAPFGKAAKTPLSRDAHFSFRDGEYLTYDLFHEGGRIEKVFYILRAGDDAVRIYMNNSSNTNFLLTSTNTENYHYWFRISNQTGTLLEQYNDEPEREDHLINRHGIFDYEKKQAVVEMKMKEEKQINTQIYRVKLIPEYPVLDLESGLLVGIRLLDLSQPGMAYFVIPEIIKEPLPVVFWKIGSETVTTPAGTFETEKVGFIVGDPLLGQLMKSYTDTTFLWIEKSAAKRVVRFVSAQEKFELTGISNILK